MAVSYTHLDVYKRQMSAYTLRRVVDGQARTQKIWVITEADRSVTTVLLPDDY